MWAPGTVPRTTIEPEARRLSKSKDVRKKLDALSRGTSAKGNRFAADMVEIRRKLRKLKPGEAKSAPLIRQPEQPKKAPEPIIIGRDIRRQPRAERPAEPDLPHVLLEEAVDGTEVESADRGPAYLVEARVSDLGDECPALSQVLGEEMTREDSDLSRWLSDLHEGQRFLPEDALFLDLETTGLSTTPLFLVGTMAWEDAGLAVRQYFARDYAEEPAAISLFLDAVAGKKLLVSFNGKAYDLPYVEMRAAATRIPFSVDMAHLDLLPGCRRAWRGIVPDCKLQTLESHICGRERIGDLPGSEIPDAYHAFVRTGNAAQIVEILRHNLLDLVTLADLMVRVAKAT